MLSKKGQCRDGALRERNLLHLRYLNNISETALLQKKLQRRILQCACAVPWHDDVPDAVTKLQQGLKQNVVLMIVRDQNEIADLGQVSFRLPEILTPLVI